MLSVPFEKLHPKAVVPKRKSAGASGYDLCCIHAEVFNGLQTQKIKTGLSLSIPQGFEGQIRLRSSVAARGYLIPNAPGTIDSDYRGEIIILLARFSYPDTDSWTDSFKAGEAIAQLVITTTFEVLFVENKNLPSTIRGNGGFGSTNDLHSIGYYTSRSDVY